MAIRALPIQRIIGGNTFERGQALYYVREDHTSTPFGPVNFPQAERIARQWSKDNDARAAETFVIVDSQIRILNFFRLGKKLLGGRIAEGNSEKVFGT